VKRPAFQWYPGDLRRDVAVQACTFEARALWREMIDLMHDGEPYGHLTAGGLPIDAPQLARIVGVTPARATRWVVELESRKVFSRTGDGVIYSRRMVRDEHIRNVRKDAGKLGGNPALLDNHDSGDLVNQTGKQKPTPAVAAALASAIAENTATTTTPDEAALLGALPPEKRLAYLSEIDAQKSGMHGAPLTQEKVDQVCRDFVGNGGLSQPSMRHFRSYFDNARIVRPPRTIRTATTRPTKQEAGLAHLTAFANSEPNHGE
jgi:hypothetical protein